MHGIIFVSMNADIPSFETDVLLDTPDALLATESAIRGVRRQFEDLSDRLWSSGEIQAVREELDGVEFTAWKQYGTPEVAKVDPQATEHRTQRYASWLDSGIYYTAFGDRPLYIYREQEYIAPLPTSWDPQAMLQLAKLEVIETRYSVYATPSGTWKFRVRHGSGPVKPGDHNVSVPLVQEVALHSGTTYRRGELAQKLAAFEARV